MDLIILNDGLYHLVPVTEEMLANLKLFNETVNYSDLCDILRIKLSTFMSRFEKKNINTFKQF